jgi:hypothetical protein
MSDFEFHITLYSARFMHVLESAPTASDLYNGITSSLQQGIATISMLRDVHACL